MNGNLTRLILILLKADVLGEHKLDDIGWAVCVDKVGDGGSRPVISWETR